MHLAVKDDELTTSAVAFLKEAVRAFPFQVTHVLTDRGSCFTADGFEEACRQLKVQHRTTKPYTPQTNGLVERFNGRVQREVLGITIHSHRGSRDAAQGLQPGLQQADVSACSRARSPEQVGATAPGRRARSWPTRASSRPIQMRLPQALQVVARAKEVSHPDT